MSAALPVVHVSPQVQARGGIGSLHEHHRCWPGHHFIALFDRDPEAATNYTNLNFNWRTPLWLMRKRFRESVAAYRDCTFVYHNGWGLPLLHDLDGAARRIAFLHGNPIYHQPDFAAMAGLLDGAISVTPDLPASWRMAWPEIAADRSVVVAAPVLPLDGTAQMERTTRPPLVIGYAGRLEKVHKRVDRLPELIRELKARKIDFRFEVLGDGSQRELLIRELKHDVHFHGWTSKEVYWRVLSDWDAMVFFSEVEGGPIAFFEGAAVGTIPFYPNITGSWGDFYAPQISPLCYYESGNIAALASAIETLFSKPPAELDAARLKARDLMAGHTIENYAHSIEAFIARIQGLPRLSEARVRRKYWSDNLLLGLVTRAYSRALLKS